MDYANSGIVTDLIMPYSDELEFKHNSWLLVVILVPLILIIINKFCVALVVVSYIGLANLKSAFPTQAFVSDEVFSCLKTLYASSAE